MARSSRWTQRRVATVLLLVIAAWIATTGSDTAAQTKTGSALPDWRIKGMDGREVSLRQWEGRVIFLSRWSTRCGPCVADLPGIESLHDSLAAEGVIFVLVSSEQHKAVRKFVRGRKLRTPAYVTVGAVPEGFRALDTPAAFVIDSSGNIAFRHQGRLDWNTKVSRDYLRSLLSTSAAFGSAAQPAAR
jgi:thiol-disulfide isomerase/thioredoxin